ncbi:FAD-dependent oxidoreductase [Subtercola boreus]|uniref:FAD-dependent oxidoreductase n=1 Tax=Subtercola boreus TaxID=120213 RepID=UPI00116DE623|nr:FAD-dependent oxidoreductase [Subtercola boreus]TQL55689.1 ferredoxin--NADP+ reductase [Subtercola boreus]
MNETAAPPEVLRVAIVGAGPAGCYTAGFLRKRWPQAAITVFDRHDAPYGLIRYGVAPDHLGTKAIAKQFDRLFARDGVTFAGNTDIGTDVSLDQLRADNDVVVLATGLWADRVIETFHTAPGTGAAAPLAGVYGSGRLTRLINGHPSESVEGLTIGRRTVIVGNGNVAADLVRLMLTPADVLASHGVAADVIHALTAGPLEHIDVVGRSPVGAAKFDVAMIRELGRLADVRFTSDAAPDAGAPDAGAPDAGAPDAAAPDAADADGKAAAIRELVAGSPEAAGRTVAFHFGWTPDRVTGDGRVSAVTFTATGAAGGAGTAGTAAGSASLELPADSVCTAVGFTETDGAHISRASVASPRADPDRGRLDDGLYAVGWFRRGPVGTIPANRADARSVADAIIADLEASFIPTPTSLT